MDIPEQKQANKIKSIPWKLVIGLVLGGSAGFLYCYFVGCATGTCPITSNPCVSVLYGAVMGGLIARI
jgi:phage shock protein E